VKYISKIAMIGAVLAAGVTAASAQNTGRPSIDTPTRNWNSGLLAQPGYGYDQDEYGYMGHEANYGSTRDYVWATPQNDGYNTSENN
jgi:hypothetical protein